MTKRPTKPRPAEEVRTASEACFQAVVENLPVFIFRKDNDGRYTFANQRFCQRYGRPREQILGRIAADLLPPEEAEDDRRTDAQIIATGGTYEAVEGRPGPDGQARFIHLIKVPVRDHDGRCVGVQGMFLDMPESKRAEPSGLLRMLLENSSDHIYFKDRASRFVHFSRAFVRKFGLADAALLRGKTDADFFTAERAGAFYAEEQEIIRGGEPIINKLEKETFLDGRVTWALSTIIPWRDDAGAVIGTFGISKDVTDLKHAEERLEQLHRQLVATSRQAGMAEVATGVLHNVGNVLNSVNVSATLVADHVRHSNSVNVGRLAALFEQHKANLPDFLANDPRGRRIPDYLVTLAKALSTEHEAIIAELDQLRENIEHIKEIVAMQQVYARLSGVFESVSVPDMIDDALRMHAGSFTRHDIQLVREYQARPVVLTDKHKVLQILINFLRNAKYACDESGRTDKKIVVQVTAHDHGVRIAVVDNGVGIPGENLTRIFTHGFTTRKDGHGFGLHSGALAAKELGGTLAAHSEGPGRGATFTLELPYKSTASPHEKPDR